MTDVKGVLGMLELVLRVFKAVAVVETWVLKVGQGWRKGKVLLGTRSWGPPSFLFSLGVWSRAGRSASSEAGPRQDALLGMMPFAFANVLRMWAISVESACYHKVQLRSLLHHVKGT